MSSITTIVDVPIMEEWHILLPASPKWKEEAVLTSLHEENAFSTAIAFSCQQMFGGAAIWIDKTPITSSLFNDSRLPILAKT